MGVLRLLPYDYEAGYQLRGDASFSDSWLNLINGEESGVNDLRADANIETRLTSYKYAKTGYNTATGADGRKNKYKRIRPKDRKKDNLDLNITGWFEGDNAMHNAAMLTMYARKANTVFLLATDQIYFYDPMGSAQLYADQYFLDDLTGVTCGPIGSLNTNDISIDTTDSVIGSSSLKYYESSALSGGIHAIRFDPGTINLNEEYIHTWIKFSKDSINCDYMEFRVVDTGADAGYWRYAGNAIGSESHPSDMSTWTQLQLRVSDMIEPGGSVSMSSIDYVEWRIKLDAGDSNSFWFWADYLSAFDHEDDVDDSYYQVRKMDFPFFVIESAQVTKRSGTQCNRFDYSITLKRVKDPPYG